MEILYEAIEYFKKNVGYDRLFKSMKNKYVSYGEVKGNIIINNPTEIEKQALSGLMKKDFSKNLSITINLNKLQEILQNTRFEGINLNDLVKGYFRGEIITKKQNIKNYKDNFNKFTNEILKRNENTYIFYYLKKSFENYDSLYHSIKKYYNKEKRAEDKQTLKQNILNACMGINRLPKEITRIPVFASNILSNPHGFDKKNVCGRIFILLLCYTNNREYPKNSEELSELYYDNNLLVDDVSNMVLCKNIEAFIKNDNFSVKQKHLGLDGFAKYNEPVFLTLYNLANISSIKNDNKYKSVFVTENPAVFMQIAQVCKVKDFPLVCTYGQVKLAGIMLLDLLLKAGFTIYYSGDLDPEGVQIADKLKQRYKHGLCLVGFDSSTYYKNLSDVFISDSRLHKLEKLKSEELKLIGSIIVKNKKPCYEEKNIDYIINFIERELI